METSFDGSYTVGMDTFSLNGAYRVRVHRLKINDAAVIGVSLSG